MYEIDKEKEAIFKENLSETFRGRVRELLDDYKGKDVELGENALINKSTFDDYKSRGKTGDTKLSIAVRWANAFGVSLDYLAGRTDIHKNPTIIEDDKTKDNDVYLPESQLINLAKAMGGVDSRIKRLENELLNDYKLAHYKMEKEPDEEMFYHLFSGEKFQEIVAKIDELNSPHA